MRTQLDIKFDDESYVRLVAGSIPEPPPPPPPPSPEDGLYGRVLHDPEYNGLSRPENNKKDVNGLPETVKCESFKKFTRNAQWLSWECLKRTMAGQSEDQVTSIWHKIYRHNAFKTNHHGWDDGYASYPTHDNVSASPMRTEVIFTGGALVKVLDGGKVYTYGGKPCYKIATLNTNKPMPSIDNWDGIRQTWWLYFAVTSQNLKNGVRRCVPLLAGQDIPILNINDADFTYIRTERVKLLGPDDELPIKPYADFPVQ